jgi:hypothetical protein
LCLLQKDTAKRLKDIEERDAFAKRLKDKDKGKTRQVGGASKKQAHSRLLFGQRKIH